MSTVKTDVKEINETRKTIIVSFTADEVAAQETQLVKDYQRQAKIPGFRPGKAPENMVRTRFSKDIASDLKNRIISQAHQEGVNGSDLNIYGIVDLEEGEITASSDAQIIFTVDIVPEFEVPSYEGLKVQTPSTDATEEEIENMYKQILSQRAEYNVVEKAAEKGDYVKCGYEGKIGDELVAELAPEAAMYGTQKVTWEEAGAENAPGVQAIVDGIVGMKAGDEKEVTMDFPEDFRVEALAGKSAVYSVKVEEVREKVMPELTEDFFKSLQVKDEEELRTQITESIANQKQQQNFQAERQQITDQLNAAVELALPESGLKSETDAILRDFMQRNMQQGATQEDFEKQKDSLHEGASEAAVSRLKSRFILGKIAEKEKIKVENEDFSQIIMNQAMQTGQKPEKIVKELQKDQGRINQMRVDILLGKTMDLLVEKAERETIEA
ncbi:trigger factor [Coraliomargarita akajimensis]|uniref:Trigger factor n=1 Tax=Coraliomargarita akajimensis (strain DSM 45221 / IAM 15411 / JCM 23193 / KCTC 12865 / 04OKA010-24) TaxID=583355 RepID=D5EPL3_CORAD|nr:trigger factor [Coraliomargarita akajimensis]ADE53750.1 trigger factor [Coraliomargarita akajimensis DSM 45221]